MGKFQASPNFIHRKITGLDVLISVGENIAKFNGYIQLNATGHFCGIRFRGPIPRKSWRGFWRSSLVLAGKLLVQM